jgi:tetratricopeptide (TPR) repeat protein
MVIRGFPKYKIFRIVIAVLFLSVSAASIVNAQDSGEQQSSLDGEVVVSDKLITEQEIPADVFEAIKESESGDNFESLVEKEELGADSDYNDAIGKRWSELLRYAKEQKLHKVHEIVGELIQKRNESNYESLDEYSLVLLQLAKSCLQSHSNDDATFYVKSALRLSPTSPLVLLHGLPLMSATGVASPGNTMWRVVKSFWYYPELSLQAVKLFIYPLLWALTFTLVFAFGLLFGVATPELLASVGSYIPRPLRTTIAPIILPFLILSPVLLGVLWTLIVWALIGITLLNRKTILPLMVSISIILWGTLLPLRENIEAWLNDEGVKSMLRITSGSFRKDDIRRVENLRERRSSDPVVSYSLGQVLLRDGAYDEAEEAFNQAEKILQSQPWTVAEKGLIAYRRGDYEEANRLHIEAHEKGLETPGFLFNYSKVAFGKLETAQARDLFLQARRKNSELVETLIEREILIGNQALAEIKLPSYLVMKYSWFEDPDANKESKKRLDILMMKMNPSHILPFGVLLAFLSFMAYIKKEARKPLASHGRLSLPRMVLFFGQIIPGGVFIVFGRELIGFWIMTLFSFLSFPLIEWPSEARLPFLWYSTLTPYYIMAFCFAWVTLCLIGILLSREEYSYV